MVIPGDLDHQGELHPALQGRVPEAERGLLRGVQAVLQVVVPGSGGGAFDTPPPFLLGRSPTLVSDTPLLEIRDLSKTFGSVQALTDVDFEVRSGEVMALVGDNGAGKSTLIKCVAGIHGYDSGRDLLRRRGGPHPRPEGRGEARDRGRLPGSRALRQPRRRAEHVPRPRDPGLLLPAQGAGDGAAYGRDAQGPSRHDDQVHPSDGRDPLGRTAPVGRGRASGDVELEARHPRRADGSARRRTDGAGARARQAAGRAGARRRPHLAQPARHLRDGDPDHRPSPRPQRRVSTSARRRRSRRSCRRSPPGSRRRSPASRRPHRRSSRERGRRDRRAWHRIARGGRRRGEARASGSGRLGNVKSGNLGVLPVVVGEILIVAYFSFTATNFFTAVELRERHPPDGGRDDDRVRRRLRPADRRDRPLDRVPERHRRADRRGAAATGRTELAGLGLHPRGARRRRRDRSRAGHLRGEGRRPVLRRHSCRLAHLAGRHPEGPRGSRRDHHRGATGSTRRRRTTSPPASAGSSLRPSPGSMRSASSPASSASGGRGLRSGRCRSSRRSSASPFWRSASLRSALMRRSRRRARRAHPSS